MKQIAVTAAAIALIGLLVGMLIVLIQFSKDGLTVHVSGEVGLANATTGVSGQVNLVMPEPVNLIATGPDKEPIPTDVSILRCPECGGDMIPVRYNLFTGDITWRCTDCGYTIDGTKPSTK
jgi:predicted RNA-binding Zn-ribbon protein involved in translation (DUF1610 family)